MNFSGFVDPYLAAVKQKQREEAGIPKGGGRPYGFDAAKFGAYMPDDGSSEIAGGNYGRVLPYAGAVQDVRRGLATPGSGLAHWLNSGGGQGRSTPSYGGTNAELRDWIKRSGSRVF